MKKYEEIQLKSVLRVMQGLEVVKVVAIEDGKLFLEKRNGETSCLPVSNPKDYKKGDYIDAIFWNHGGRVIGHTPPGFSPDMESPAARLAIQSARRNRDVDTRILDNFRR